MKKLFKILKKHSGRSKGKVTVRHQGGREKRYLRMIDFKRDKVDVIGLVKSVEYDPNRNCFVALINYKDGEKRYILAPHGLRAGDSVVTSLHAQIAVGNCLPMGNIPVGTQIHNLEIKAGKGGQLVKSAGSAAIVFGKEELSDKDSWVLVKLPSGEIRRFDPKAYATVGQLSNIDIKNRVLGKAGRKRHMGIRPSVRGVAMHPNAHPHGGGEGRSGIGMKTPKTFYGRKAYGKTRTRVKYSDHLIVQRKGGKTITLAK